MDTHPDGGPVTANAWLDDVLVARSERARVMEADGTTPRLVLPRADVDVTSPHGTSFVVEADAGMVELDAQRVRLELLDEMGSTDPRDHTFRRFPAWGDVADLVRILDVRPDGDGRYVSEPRADRRRSVVEGSQMLGQAIVAAGRHAPGRRAVSTWMAFLRVADGAEPLTLELTERSHGRTFTALSVDVVQGGRVCATGNLLLDVGAPDLIRHSVTETAVAGPYESAPLDMAVTGRDVRVVDGAYDNDPNAPIGPPEIDAWVRFREVPNDPYLNAGLVAQLTGHMSVAAALRPHVGIGQAQAHREISTAVNAIGLSLHSDIRADQWMRFHHESTFAGDGMTHSECRVHDASGALLASFTTDGMVRRLENPGIADEGKVL